MRTKGTLLYVFLALFLIIVIYVVANLSAGRTTFFGRASQAGIFNSTNSVVFGSPLSGRAGGDKIRITVFALDDTGKGVPNKSVSLNCKDLVICQNSGIIFSPVQPGTDNTGQAIYDLSSPVPGSFELQAGVGGLSVPQTVTVVFK